MSDHVIAERAPWSLTHGPGDDLIWLGHETNPELGAGLTRDDWLWLMLVAAPAAIFALGPDGHDRRGDARVVGLKDAPGGAGGTPPDAQVTIFEELADSEGS